MVFDWLFARAPPADKPWADGPFSLIPASETDAHKGIAKDSLFMAQDMTIIHNTLIRTMNTIYLQCVNVSARGTPKDVADFAEYALTWGEVISDHHHTEETMVFDEIERLAGAPGIMQANKDQHAAFHPGLDAYTEYLKRVVAGQEPYDGGKLKGIIDGFMPVLTTHLHEEIQTLKGVARYEDKTDWKKWMDELVAKIMGRAADNEDFKLKTIPFMLANNDKSYDNGAFSYWPALPFLASLMFRFWFFPTHKRLWRFGSTTSGGRRKELPFADKKDL